MLKIIKLNWSLFLLLIIYFIIGGILISVFEKGDLVILLNKFYTPFLNWLFRAFSFIGNGWFTLIIIAIAYPINKYKFLVLGVNSLICGITVQFLKKVVFSDMLRPVKVLGTEGYNFVEGVEIVKYYSFPSGHTTSAFALMIMLALLIENKRMSFILFLFAICAAFARVYLFQHFYMDTYAAAIISASITIVTYYIFENHTNLPKIGITNKWKNG